MKAIVICGKGCYQLTPAHIQYLHENGYPDANEHSFIEDRTNPDLIACIDAVRNVPIEIERTVHQLRSAIEDVECEHQKILVDYDKCESALGYYLRSLARSLDRYGSKRPNENDIRRNRTLVGNVRKRNEWITCCEALRNNINFVYDDEIEKDIQYLYEEIRSVIPSNCDIRHTWDVNTVVQILEQYMMQHLPTWDKFIKLFYEFIQYDISDVDYDKAKNCYEEYISFMEMHGDIVKNYIAMEDNLEQYMQENSLAFGSHNGKEKLIFSSPLVIKEYDDSIYTATVAKGTNAYREEDAYEYLKVTPCLKRHIIDDFVRNGDSDGLWNFLKRFNFDNCEYQE